MLEVIRIFNIHLPINSVKIYEAKTKRNAKENRSTIILGDFNTLFSVID